MAKGKRRLDVVLVVPPVPDNLTLAVGRFYVMFTKLGNVESWPVQYMR